MHSSREEYVQSCSFHFISDNAKVFKATVSGIEEIRRSEQLKDYFAKQGIGCQLIKILAVERHV